jgi:hypothetical protein
MSVLLGAIVLSAWVPAPAPGATEQEALEELFETMRTASERLVRAKAVEQYQTQSALEITAEERELNMLFAQRALAADIAVATTELVASDAAASEARREYQSAVSQALSRFRQGINEAQNDWSRSWNEAYNRIQRSSSDAFQEIYNDISRAQSTLSNVFVGGNAADMPPVIEPSLPDFSVEADGIVDVVKELQKAGDEARARYRVDIAAAAVTCDEALSTALSLPPGDEMAAAMRKAVVAFKIACLDRHDQYAVEVRTIARHALLRAEE